MKLYQVTKHQHLLQLSLVWKIKDLKSKVRRINLNKLYQINWTKFWTSYLVFGTGDISPRRFTLGWAFHRPPKSPFSWFAWVTAWALLSPARHTKAGALLVWDNPFSTYLKISKANTKNNYHINTESGQTSNHKNLVSPI